MAQGALVAAGVRRVGYGLDVGRSVRTADGAGAIVSPRAQLLNFLLCFLFPLIKLKRPNVSPHFRICMLAVTAVQSYEICQ